MNTLPWKVLVQSTSSAYILLFHLHLFNYPLLQPVLPWVPSNSHAKQRGPYCYFFNKKTIDYTGVTSFRSWGRRAGNGCKTLRWCLRGKWCHQCSMLSSVGCPSSSFQNKYSCRLPLIFTFLSFANLHFLLTMTILFCIWMSKELY